MTELQLQTIASANQISNSFLRDLFYLLSLPTISFGRISPSLEYYFEQRTSPEDLRDWVLSLEQNLVQLPADSLPLGKYAESIIGFYLKNHPTYALVAQNLQLYDHQITVGELDYLFQDTVGGEFIHLEFAIKYYLKVDYKGEERFLGPSTKDWFQRKLNKLNQQQSLHTIQYKHLLPLELQKMNFLPKIMVKGALFYPYQEWKASQEINGLTEGWWIPVEEMKDLANENCFYEIKERKREWICPFYAQSNQLNFEQLINNVTALLKEEDALLIARYSLENRPLDFGFVVREKWPN